MAAQLYDQEFFAWANQQAGLLRASRLGEADIENIAEEIESIAKSEKRQLAKRLSVLLLQLLKWQYQPDHRSARWLRSACSDAILPFICWTIRALRRFFLM